MMEVNSLPEDEKNTRDRDIDKVASESETPKKYDVEYVPLSNPKENEKET